MCSRIVVAFLSLVIGCALNINLRTMTDYRVEFGERFISALERDDPAALVELYHENPDEVASFGVWFSAQRKAKKCLTALVIGEVFEPPPAAEGCATDIHLVSWYFPDPDVITMMLLRGGVMDLKTKCFVGDNYGTPLQILLEALSSVHRHLRTWCLGDSIFKLIILLCQWGTKHRLDVARKFVPETDSVNDLAWTFLRDGKLMELAALLLVAREEVMAPLKTGRTIRQAAMDLMDTLNFEEGVDHERDQYKSLLMDGCKLLDVFETAADALNSYSKMMCRHIPVDKVLVDVVMTLKKAGFSLQVRDVDLRDCYRGRSELWNDELFTLLDIPRPGSKHSSLTYPTVTLGSEPFRDILFRHWDPFLSMFKSGRVVKLSNSVPRPRLLSTTARQMDPIICARSSIPVKHLACVAMKLKRGIRYL